MLPLARFHAPGDAVLVGPAGEVRAAQFFAQAARLANALPPAENVINLCETRHGFMLGFAAALIRGQVSLLPPGRGRGDWEALAKRYPGTSVLSESPALADGAFAIGRWLEAGEPATLVIPSIDPDRVAAILFTSGSTGEPAAHAKTWGQLWRGAQLLAIALGWQSQAPGAIVGSVPPQHMFGLETTVVLAWREGLPVHAHEPLLAADLEDALRDCARPAWWMSTPMHLRAPLQGDSRLPGLQGIVASTMSLPAELAQAAESAWGAPVIEVYGSTETGALATRHTASEIEWTPLPGVLISAEGEGESQRFLARAPHVGAPVVLGDLLELHADGRFRWLGRTQDLVKVSGKRASLAALNLALTTIAGIDDGAFAFPPEAAAEIDEFHPARRLVAFYVSGSLDRTAVLAELRERIDPAFLPRPLYRVAQLPRNANGKLPQSGLSALFAQCRSQSIPAGHPALPGHFPGNPIVPGVTLLARVVEALRLRFPGHAPGELVQARFHRPLLPGEAFTIAIREEGLRARFDVRLAGDGTRPGELLASGEWLMQALAPDPPAT